MTRVEWVALVSLEAFALGLILIVVRRGEASASIVPVLFLAPMIFTGRAIWRGRSRDRKK
jgi:hypothetical protein